MATYPFKVCGTGSKRLRNVFRVKFSQPLSSVPYLKCYDNAAAFPNTDSSTSTLYKIFKGSTGNEEKPMLAYHSTCRGSTYADDWYSLATISAGTFIALMSGDASYLKFDYSVASIDVALGTCLYWHAQMSVPYDVNPTFTKHHNVCFVYTFTSTIPTIWFHANNYHEGGTDGSPVWGTITTDTNGVRFGSSTATNTSILANIPISGEEKTETAWISTS